MKNLSRKEFLGRGAALGVASLATTLSFAPFGLSAKERKRGSAITFGVISDVHQDIMFDAEERLQSFLDEAKSKKVDFVIELGDFCQAKEANIPFVNRWNSFSGDKFHVIGNHDLDITDKAEYMEFAGMSSRYYSVDKGDFHIIVLDPNNILVDGSFRSPFRSGRYGDHVDSEQMEWLKKDIESTDKRCIVFSHQSFERDGVIKNGEQVREIFERENERVGYTKVAAVLSGHDHTDYQRVIRGISYIQVNSASNQWVGGDYICDARYSKEIDEKYPYMKYTTPYKDSLYAFVTIDSEGVTVKGKKSSFVAPTPDELNIPRNIHNIPLVPYISDYKYTFAENIY